ncbi:MAG: AAA family ATPase [Bacillati bacterium]
MAHDIVVLVGSPGTGKTLLANTLASALGEALGSKYTETVRLQITSEYDVSRLLGYETLEGDLSASPFTSKLLIASENQLNACIVILDEWNLAKIDEYFAPVLASLESGNPLALPGRDPSITRGSQDGDEADFERSLPVDLFVIATCNSYLEEPETRQKLSRPVKRRSTIFHVPNFLAIDAEANSVPAAVEGLATLLIDEEKAAVAERISERSATAIDRYRQQRFDECPTYASIDEQVRKLLEGTVEILLREPAGKQFLTIGVLKDVVLNVIFSEPRGQVDVLARQVAGKLLPLYSGPMSAVRPIGDVFAETIGHLVVQGAIEEMERAAEGIGDTIPLV